MMLHLVVFVLSLVGIVKAEDPYRFFTWNITYGDIYPFGVRQQGILINGQFPGPEIYSVTNDNIIINVFNNLPEPFLLSWSGVQQRKNSFQDGVYGTTCPIPPGMNFTYMMQMKDQIGSFYYFPSLAFHKAAGAFGAIKILSRPRIPVPFPDPDGDFSILIGDWYKANHKVLQSILDKGKMLPFPDGVLINGRGANDAQFTVDQVDPAALDAALQRKEKRKRRRSGAAGETPTPTPAKRAAVEPTPVIDLSPPRVDEGSSAAHAAEVVPHQGLSFLGDAGVVLDGVAAIARFVTSGAEQFKGLLSELEEAKATAARAAEREAEAAAAAEAARRGEAVAVIAADEARRAAAELEAEVARLRAAQVENRERLSAAAAEQSGVIRGVAERIFRSKHFGDMAAQLVGAMSTPITSATLDRVAKDYPELDKSKYGYEVVTKDDMLREYAEVLVECTSSVPVVEQLAQQRTLLTEKAVRGCPVDRDDRLEAIIAELAAAEVEGGRGPEGGEECAPLCDILAPSELAELRRALEVAEVEAECWKSRAANIEVEMEAKLRTAQEKLDEEHARFLQLEDEFKRVREDLQSFKAMGEEHEEYEEIIHKGGGLTIYEVLMKVKDVRARVKRYVERYGEDSWEVRDQEDELLRLCSLYKTVLKRKPKLKKWAQSEKARRDSSAQDFLDGRLAGVHPPSAALTREQTQAIMSRGGGRRATGGRGRTSQVGRGRGRTAPVGRGRGPFGRGQGMEFLDSVLGQDVGSSSGQGFVEKYLNFSRRSGSDPPP